MLASDLIAYSMRIAGVEDVGLNALAQDTADAETALRGMLQQWQRRRWLVYRLDDVTFPLTPGKGDYTVGPVGTVPAPDVLLPPGTSRPGSIESWYLRQTTGVVPGSFPIDFPMRQYFSRQEYDAIPLKLLTSWPSAFFWDKQWPVGTVRIYPVPMQNFFEMHVGFQQGIANVTPELDFDTYLPDEAEEALWYNLAVKLCVNYKIPLDQGLVGQATATLATLRKTNFALQPLGMPQALRRAARLKNPMGGFYPETSAGIPTSVLG